MADALVQLAMRFPDAARALWDASAKVQAYLAGLSPEIRAQVFSAVSWTASFLFSCATIFFQVYHLFMALPGATPDQWTPPPDFVTKSLATVLLWLMPLKDSWDSVLEDHFRPDDAMESLSLVSAIYLKTGLLPRRYTDVYHFKIPIWKHLIEYFGAIPATPQILSAVMATGHPVLIHPGGRRAALKNRVPPSPNNDGPVAALNWTPGRAAPYLSLAATHGYAAVAAGTAGVDSMFRVVLNVRVDPLLWLAGEGRLPPAQSRDTPVHRLLPTRSDEDLVATAPLVLPRSYRRQYLAVRVVPGGGDGNGELTEAALAAAVAGVTVRARAMEAADGERAFLFKGLFDRLETVLRDSNGGSQAGNSGGAERAGRPQAAGEPSQPSGGPSTGEATREVGLEDMVRLATSFLDGGKKAN
ncbi:hypothetical protein HK405_008745 [Cladochytrium tenue]|nr:hypothetical protein HK405_008745 [Cladochytrium tenue]